MAGYQESGGKEEVGSLKKRVLSSPPLLASGPGRTSRLYSSVQQLKIVVSEKIRRVRSPVQQVVYGRVVAFCHGHVGRVDRVELLRLVVLLRGRDGVGGNGRV